MDIYLIRGRRARAEGARSAAYFFYGMTNFVIREWKFLEPFSTPHES